MDCCNLTPPCHALCFIVILTHYLKLEQQSTVYIMLALVNALMFLVMLVKGLSVRF